MELDGGIACQLAHQSGAEHMCLASLKQMPLLALFFFRNTVQYRCRCLHTPTYTCPRWRSYVRAKHGRDPPRFSKKLKLYLNPRTNKTTQQAAIQDYSHV